MVKDITAKNLRDRIVECNCTKGVAGKAGDLDTIRCEEATCTIEDFPQRGSKRLRNIEDITAVKVNLEQ